MKDAHCAVTCLICLISPQREAVDFQLLLLILYNPDSVLMDSSSIMIPMEYLGLGYTPHMKAPWRCCALVEELATLFVR